MIQSNDKPDKRRREGHPGRPRRHERRHDVDLQDTWNGIPGLQAHLTADFQQWTLTPIPNNATYGVLKNKHTNTCLAGKGSAAVAHDGAVQHRRPEPVVLAVRALILRGNPIRPGIR